MKFLLIFVVALLPLMSRAQTAQQPNCTVNPGACQSAPVPSTCLPAHHWTLMGSGIAHCVADDPVCPGGTELTHDWLGNPSCFVLIITTETRPHSCPSGQQGSKEQERTATTHADGSKTYSAWTTTYDDCADIPVPPPTGGGGTGGDTGTGGGGNGGDTGTGGDTGPGGDTGGQPQTPEDPPKDPPKQDPVIDKPVETPVEEVVMVNCPVSVITRFTSTKLDTLCWNERTVPTPPQVPKGQTCVYGAPEILNYGSRGGLTRGNGCEFN